MPQEEMEKQAQTEKPAEDAIQESIPQVYSKDNPFIRAEESEEYKRLEKEYREYRAKKVLSRIDGVILPSGSIKDVKEELKNTALGGRAKAVVLPCYLKLAKKELPTTVRIEALINYPLCANGKKAVLSEIKGAFAVKADMAVGINTASFAAGNTKPTEKELKLLYKKGKGKKVKIYPLFDLKGLSTEQKSRLARLVKQYKFTGVKIACDRDGCGVESAADTVKIFTDVLSEQCPVEAVGAISDPTDAETLFSAGADRIITLGYHALRRKKLDDISI